MEKSLPFPSIVIQLAGEGRLVSCSQTATFLLCGGGKVDYFSRPSLMVVLGAICEFAQFINCAAYFVNR